MTINSYATLALIKAAMPENEVSTTTNWDALVTELCGEVSRQFDKYTNRKPGAYYVTDDTTQYFDGPGYGLYSPIYGYRTQRLSSGYTGAINLRVGELATFPTSVSMAQTGQIATGNGANPGVYTLVPATDYYAEPQNAADYGLPYNSLGLDIINGTTRVWIPFKRGIQVVGKFGYSTTVPLDVQRAVVLMIVRLIRKAQQNYLNTGVILDSGQVMTGFSIDTDVADAISHYRRLPI